MTLNGSDTPLTRRDLNRMLESASPAEVRKDYGDRLDGKAAAILTDFERLETLLWNATRILPPVPVFKLPADFQVPRLVGQGEVVPMPQRPRRFASPIPRLSLAAAAVLLGMLLSWLVLQPRGTDASLTPPEADPVFRGHDAGDRRGIAHDWARLGQVAPLQTYLSEGGDVNERDPNNRTLLHLAASNGQDEVIQLLVRHGAQIDSLADHRKTPLMLAAEHGHVDALNMLLEHGADASLRDAEEQTAAQLAARYGYGDIADLLDQRNRDPRHSNQKR
ncbi:Ankyrin repeat domain-containing protein [Sulfidibacter corallicola]|uniref:Ankyrin repeat domain-containing protein n=1 Tax=Sulfidibacter corallicola TaxID=2818388 RepID=A0A8A4TL00_SULCO|nr:ankyrin repeat domain-containing protein [Sulfidibacter corallicola]QTD49528.1 ankyrin repeat domain-containing protein [Sulfidibacter corallicola]